MILKNLLSKLRPTPQTALIRELDLRIKALKDDLAKATSRIQQLEKGAASTQEILVRRENELKNAVANYRATLQKENPEIPAELLTGESIPELDQSLVKARELVERVKACIHTQNNTLKVPAGAPPRSGPNPDSLSSTEKIKQGLESVRTG